MVSPVQTISLSLGRPEALLVLVPTFILALVLFVRTARTRRKLAAALGGRFRKEYSGLALKLAVAALICLSLAEPYVSYSRRVDVPLDKADLLSSRPVLHVVLLDVSRSMTYMEAGEGRISIAKKVLKKYFSQLPSTDRVLLAVFSRKVETLGLSTPSSALEELGGVEAEGRYSAVGDALVYAVSACRVSQTPSVVLLVTDGGWNYGSSPLDAAKAYSEEGIPLVIVRVGSDPRGSSLYEVADKTGSRVYEADEFSLEAINDMVGEIREFARYSALKARGLAYVEVEERDYSPTLYVLLVAAALLPLSLKEGV